MLAPVLLTLLVDLLKKRVFRPALYDQREVARKTGQMAYRVRIFLYVFGPEPRHVRRAGRRQYVHLFGATLLRHGARLWRKRAQRSTRPPLRCVRLLQRGWRQWQDERRRQRAVFQRRHDALTGLAAAYRQFDTASAGYFIAREHSSQRATSLRAAGWIDAVRHSRHLLTADVLSRAWSLPHATLFDLPGIAHKRARTVLVPTSLIAPAGAPALGISRHAGYAFPFALPAGFLQQHTLIGGKTGEGKSTVMIHLARAAMEQGAVCVIDPHGDLAHDVLRSVPVHRHGDVVFVDLGDAAYAVGLNPLDATLGRERDLTVAALVDAFRSIWESGWGTRMEAPFRSAILTLYEANQELVQQGRATQQYTLLDVAPLLLDASFCHDVLAHVRDPYLHRFWYQYYESLDTRQQRERIDPVLTKMQHFESLTARRILGQSRSTLDLHALLHERTILVIRLAASEAGLAAPILGATLLSLLMRTLREQSTLPLEQRVRMSILVDEFQRLPGADYALLLAELRKFGGAAVLATQSLDYLSHISPQLLPTTLANVKQYLLFRLSAEDAKLMAREFTDVREEDFLNLDSHSCYVKLIHHGQQQPTFSLETTPLPLHERDVIDLLRLQSRRWSRPVGEIEQDLVNALARTLGAGPSTRAREASAQRRTAGVALPTSSAGPADEMDDAGGRDTASSSVTTTGKETATMNEQQPVKPTAAKTGRIRFESKRARVPSPAQPAPHTAHTQPPHTQKEQEGAPSALITSFDLHPEAEPPHTLEGRDKDTEDAQDADNADDEGTEHESEDE